MLEKIEIGKQKLILYFKKEILKKLLIYSMIDSYNTPDSFKRIDSLESNIHVYTTHSY